MRTCILRFDLSTMTIADQELPLFDIRTTLNVLRIRAACRKATRNEAPPGRGWKGESDAERLHINIHT
jgi:hypothetical protein